MIRSNLIALFLVIMIALSPLSMTFAQTTPLTQSDLETIWVEYQILQKLMPELGLTITTLQTNLTILESRVIELENQLAIARNCVVTSDEYIANLESQLIELEMSLENTKTTIDTAPGKYDNQINEIVISYDTEIAKIKTQRNTLLLISISEALLLALGLAFANN